MKNPLSINYSKEENLALVDKVLEGDLKALDKLVDIHQAFIYIVAWKMTKKEMKYYAAPYPTIKSRKPFLQWPLAVPFDGGKPKDVAKALASWNKWLFETDIPKLCFYVSPGVAIKEKDVRIIKERMKNLKMIGFGEGLHFIQEDYPHEIGSGIAEWYQQINN